MAQLPGEGIARVKTPTVLQVEVVECGAASLAMVLASYGRWLTLEDLRLACGVSRDGAKASNIMRAARLHGLEAKGFKTTFEKLKEVTTPAIAFVNMNHFLVIEGFTKGKVHLNDPAAGRRLLSEEEFDRIYSGVVLTFKRTDAFEEGGQRPGVLGRLLGWLDGSRDAVGYVIAAGISVAVFGIIIPGFTRTFIDQYLIDEQKDWLPWILTAFVGAAIFQALFSWLQSTITDRLRLRVTTRASARFVWRMLRLPVGFYAQRFPGEIGGRVDLATQLGDHAGKNTPTMVIESLSILLFLIIMTGFSPLLALITALFASANIVMFLTMRKRIEEQQQKATLDTTKLVGKTMIGLQMVETLKASASEGTFFESWSGSHALVVGHEQRVGRISAIFASIPDFLSQLGTVTVLVTGGWLVMEGKITVGTLLAFQLLQAGINAPLANLMATGLQLQNLRGVVDQVEDVITHPIADEFQQAAEDTARAQASTLGNVHRLSGHVQLRDLTFGYNPLDKPLIEDFSLELRPGTRVALVGASGSGKSTVGKLVTGLYQPWSGEILLDGRAIADVPRPLLRNSLAVVDQDIVLFEGTVRQNIALWDETLPDDIIIAAARDAMIHDAIVMRPGGYDAAVEEGGRNFSGGQRQRIEMARALVTKPTLLVLDEATSALDPVVEKQIIDNLRRRGCACLIIAHRLSTIRDCDEIIVMHRGKVLERGTHDELMALQANYAKLIES